MSSPAVKVSFKEVVVGEAKTDSRFKGLGLVYTDLSRLYEIVMQENEAFDGEEVGVDFMVRAMYARYMAVGLTPSRN